jgi:hypothetical protein
MHCFANNVQVAFVAIGATMVGSITFLKKEGDYVRKGDEVSFILFPSCDYSAVCAGLLNYLTCPLLSQFGYFSFGGSTVICVFEKVCSFLSLLFVSFFLLDTDNQLSKTKLSKAIQYLSLQFHKLNPLLVTGRNPI